jgi:hypothetical protein
MILEHRIPSFWEWIPTAFLMWLAVVGALFVTAIVVGYFVAFFRGNGFTESFFAVGRGIKHVALEITQFSFRRTGAIAKLAVTESIRKKVIIIFVVFLVLLMLAGWYLDPNNPDPAKLYLSFVLSATSYLMLLLALFLSAFSLPNDIKKKTIFTLMTKPVRASEIVLGRMLGFTLIGTAILVFMTIMSYLFVQMGLKHTHVLTSEDLTTIEVSEELAQDNPDLIVMQGDTRLENGHRHRVQIDASGNVTTSVSNNHSHSIRIEEEDGREKYIVGVEEGTIQARVPIYGELSFRDTQGIDRRQGINVGNEWEYRSFIEGESPSAAIWRFDEVTSEKFPHGLPVEMTLGVYRSHKGDIEKPVSGSLMLRNPKTGLTVDAAIFLSEEFVTKAILLPRKIDSANAQIISRKSQDFQSGQMVITPPPSEVDSSLTDKKEFDLFEDLVADGQVEIWLKCLDRGQYFGAGEPDLYLRAREASLMVNFVKGFFGIWQQMVLIIAFGVMFSTFLSGPVAMISTFGVMIAGFAHNLLMMIANREMLGGGMIEAFVRLVQQKNMLVELPTSMETSVIKSADAVISGILWIFEKGIPPLADYFLYSEALASGFDISFNWILVHGTTTLAYVFILFLIGFIILSNREVAK